MPYHLPRVVHLLVGMTLAAGVLAAPGTALGARPVGATDTWIVTLNQPDMGTLPTRRGGLRVSAADIARQRAAVTGRSIDALEVQVGFQATQRFTSAVAGFAAPLDAIQLASLRRDPRVVSLRRSRPVELAGGQVEPAGIVRIGAPSGSAPAANPDVAVAVVDTGVGRWVNGGWRHGDELNIVGGVNAYDPKGGACGERVSASPAAYHDTNGHGTHVAGTIGASDNGVGVVGVAPNVKLYSVRVFQGVSGSDATVICGLDWIHAWNVAHAGDETNDIDVVNMSLRGYAPPTQNTGCGTPGNEDPEEIAVCNVVASGASVVVAAGNETDPVSYYIPSRYESVITVSAMSDFDGQAGGLAQETCVPPRGPETDDAFSRYSNFGPEVDITAPGTCVRSTDLASAGGVTMMSGTSMATPHVAGAIARYLALDPAKTPDQVRAALIDSATLDWDAATDPDDKPDRLVDVEALVSEADDLAVFTVPQLVMVPGGTAERSVKVRIQRVGGYADAVDLSAVGPLPHGVADVSFGDGTIPVGHLGQVMTITFAAEPDDGVRELTIRAEGDGSGPTDQVTLRLRFDRSPPAVGSPWPRIVFRSGSWSNLAPVRLSWDATDAQGPLDRQEVQRSRKGGPFSVRPPRPARGAGSADVSMERWVPTAWRIKAWDQVGNATVSDALSTRLVPTQAGNADVGDGWKTVRRTTASAQDLLVTKRSRRTVTHAFTGRGVAIVAPKGPGKGRFRVRIDGAVVANVDLAATSDAARRIVYASAALTPGSHQIRVTSLSGTVELDAFLVLR